MLTHTRRIQYSTDEGLISTTAEPITGDGVAEYDGVVVHNATPANSEVEIDLAFPQAKIKSILLSASGAAITIRSNANHSGAPGDAPTVAAGAALVWNTNDSGNNPFHSADVTKLYITNESATNDATVKIRVLLDVTP